MTNLRKGSLPKKELPELSLCVNCFNYPINGRSYNTCTAASNSSCRFFDTQRCQEEYAIGRQNFAGARLGF